MIKPVWYRTNNRGKIGKTVGLCLSQIFLVDNDDQACMGQTTEVK